MSLQVSQPTSASAPKELQQPQQNLSLTGVWKLKGQETANRPVPESKLDHILDEVTSDDADESEHSDGNVRLFPYSREEDWNVPAVPANKTTKTALPALSASHPTGVWSNEIESLEQEAMKNLWEAFDQVSADNDTLDEGKSMEDALLCWT
jgi:hypothetical protein